MHRILGLDLGTNSIGWAVVDSEEEKILGAGSRILPMDQGTISKFENGKLQSQAALRTAFRGTRKMYERSILRRERLLRVLNIMNFLPEYFKSQIDFDRNPGKFKNHGEPKLPYAPDLLGKNQFIFQSSFNEMLADIKIYNPEMISDDKKIPYDWTIYYLRNKALTKPISKEELAWILLNFNTKRGYYQRGEEVEMPLNKKEEYKTLTVAEIIDEGPNKKDRGYHWYNVKFDNGVTKQCSSPLPPYSIGQTVEVIVTSKLDKDGNVKVKKDGELDISLRVPKDDDWTLLKKRSEHDIEECNETVGSYIYKALITKPDIKIRGKLVRTIERKFYREEIIQILEKQKEFIKELSDKKLYDACLHELYHNNEEHIKSMPKCDFKYLFVNDILFYHRPLKSKKGEISDCPYEYYSYVDKETGEIKKQHIKCISKSHPLFQEFRTLQFIQDTLIYKREDMVEGKFVIDHNVTSDYIKTPEDIANLCDALSFKKNINEEQFLKIFKLNKKKYRWNHVEDKTYPLNETRYNIRKFLDKIDKSLTFDIDTEDILWHILYSINNEEDLHKALQSFALKLNRNKTDEERISFAKNFANTFSKFPQFDSSYGSYSKKAIKKLLSLMRGGHSWNANTFDEKTMLRINKIINEDFDDTIPENVRTKLKEMKSIEQFQNLSLWQACYILYGRHSESTDLERFSEPEDILRFLKFEFKKEGLRNPVVESVLGETLRVVYDIWGKFGKPQEIHVEMGRELKLPNDKRKQMTDNISAKEQINLRIRAMLQEFANPDFHIADVRPNSPMQQDILKIYEENILENNETSDEIQTVIDTLGNPSVHVKSSDVLKYATWLEQKYRSPYTGEIIPLSRLFTPDYQIEHIIPRSLYFDDSYTNKVICEAEVNIQKGAMLGMEFINNCHGMKIQCHGKTVEVFSHENYENFIKENYSKNKTKMRKLLMEEIPDSFIERQLNDTRYISRRAIELMSKIVREEDEKEAVSKNVISLSGSITDTLKKDWGMNDVWNSIVAPRFERMNRISNTSDFGQWYNKGGKQFFMTDIPVALSKGFKKKRIDHRHHAMDAIVIACITRNHINYLNNSAAKPTEKGLRKDLRTKLCQKTKPDSFGNYRWTFNKPWETFTQDAFAALNGIIVSFKQNLRIITNTTNAYWHYVNGKKVLSLQKNINHCAIRKPLHKATIFGKVYLREEKRVSLSVALDNISSIKDRDIRKIIRNVVSLYSGYDKNTILKYFKDRDNTINGKDLSKIILSYIPETSNMYASRVTLNTSSIKNADDIEKITDSGIRKILYNHLNAYKIEGKDHPEIAFSPKGVAEMNRNIKTLNGSKDHKPIYSIRKTKKSEAKFSIGDMGSKSKKFVESEKGTNLFFAIYTDTEDNRYFESIAFNEAIERIKNNEPVAPCRDSEGHKLLFTLSPGDLVYVPSFAGENVSTEDISNSSMIFKMVSNNDYQAFFIPETIASPISNKVEVSSHNKSEKPWHGIPIKTLASLKPNAPLEYIGGTDWYNSAIKKTCYKLKVDRLGNIVQLIK